MGIDWEQYKKDWITKLDGYAYGYIDAKDEPIAAEFIAEYITAKAKFMQQLERNKRVKHELVLSLVSAAHELMDELGY